VAVALVTGANTGIGFAIAERLLRDGFSLAYATQGKDETYRGPYARLSELGHVHWVAGDLTDPAVPQRLVDETVGELGGIDVLVNNAGLSTAKPALELTAEDFVPRLSRGRLRDGRELPRRRRDDPPGGRPAGGRLTPRRSRGRAGARSAARVRATRRRR
jgi:hypothetical protein